MAYGYEYGDSESGGGSRFAMGLLTGTLVGAGVAILFAPKAGAEIRGRLAEQAGTIANTASEQFGRAKEVATDWAGRGREAGQHLYQTAREAINKGADEAQRYVREETTEMPGWSRPPVGTSDAGPSFDQTPRTWRDTGA